MCQKCNHVEHAETATADVIEPFEYHSERKLYSSPVGELTQETRDKIQGIIHLWEMHIDKPGKGLIPPIETILDFVGTWENFGYHSYGDVYNMFNPYIMTKRNQSYSMGIPLLHPVSADTEDKRQANRLKLAQQWHRFLSDCYGMTTSPSTSGNTLGQCISAVIEDTETKGQSFAKRLAKQLAKTGRKLSKSQIETINNLAEAGTTKPKSEWIAFDDDYLTGSAGNYGNSRSCWWQDGAYSAGRPSLHEAGGYACRTFDEQGKFAGGRCWIVPIPEGHLIFNAYGLQLKEFAKLLSSMWKCAHVNVDVSRPSDIYINGDDGFILGVKEKLPRDGNTYTWDVEVIDGDDGCVECDDCDGRIDPDDCYHDPNGNAVCESCYCERYSGCGRCGETFDIDDVIEFGGDRYCESCAERKGYHKCQDCDEWHDDCTDVCSSSRYEWVCSDCLDNYTCCESCSDWMKSEDSEHCEADGCTYCSDCLPEPELEGEQYCQATGELIDVEDISHDETIRNPLAHCPGLASFENGEPVQAYPVSNMWETLAAKPHLLDDPRCTEARTVYALCMSGF